MKSFKVAAVVAALPVALILQAALSGSACAQAQKGQTENPLAKAEEIRKKQEYQEAEKDYNATMKRLRSSTPAEAKSDPWATVRPVPSSGEKRK